MLVYSMIVRSHRRQWRPHFSVNHIKQELEASYYYGALSARGDSGGASRRSNHFMPIVFVIKSLGLAHTYTSFCMRYLQ